MKNAQHKRQLTGLMLALTIATPVMAATALPTYTDQGNKWTKLSRDKYYTQDQGSRFIPLAWIKALKQPNGAPFMADSLSRYGYLPNPNSPEPGLPVGFVATPGQGGKVLGLTCAACHTRQIEVDKVAYRIDGGPAISDIQSLFADLDMAVGAVLKDPKTFSGFASAVLGPNPSKAASDKLQADLAAWYLPYDTIMKASLPTQSPWGPSRLDAVSMIFNRLSGLDIGPAPTYIIKENIKLADAPVRYPFLWNAPIQDMTQWPGFSPNGNRILGLSRNVGEVIGVFAQFHPQQDDSKIYKINYTAVNSANFSGLNKLESLIMRLGPPKWPWQLDSQLVAEGEKVFNKKDPAEENKSCADCHGISTGKPRSLTHSTWATPILDVGTDSREVILLGSEVKTGILSGAQLYPGQTPLKPVDKAFSVLGMAVGGSILQHYIPVELSKDGEIVRNVVDKLAADVKSEADKLAAAVKGEVDDLEDLSDLGSLDDLKDAFKMPTTSAKATTATTASYPYESRVLEGIWAVAPYLHNGSVPTLAQLLTPSAQRVAEFKIGSAYDKDHVGLAVAQSQFNFTLKTTGCDDRNSGNSRCGHDYGTTFTDAEKKALLEYLKNL